MRTRRCAILAFAFGTFAAPGLAQTTLSPQESGNRLVEAARQRPAIIIGTFTVDGTVVYNAPVLAAAQVIFKPGATLVFSTAALQEGPSLFVFARDVESQDPQRPGKIIWQKVLTAAPPALGTAPAGVDNGAREEAAGGNGQNGRTGYYGHDGEAGPNLTIITDKVGAPLMIDVSGNDGGPGGTGETGGRGGGAATVIRLVKEGSTATGELVPADKVGMVVTGDQGGRAAMAVAVASSR